MSTVLGMIAMVRNDTTVAEWVAYHRAIGFQEFIIIDDASDDGTWERLEYMALVVSWVKCRRLNIEDLKPEEKKQLAGYRQAMALIPPSWDWVAFMDIDEYLVTRDGRSLNDLFQVENAVCGVALNWKCFGASTRGTGLLIERTVRCASIQSKYNLHYKCLARPKCLGAPFSTHRPNLQSGEMRHDFDSAYDARSHGRTTEVRWKHAWINHYKACSLTSWIKRQRRGLPRYAPNYAPLTEFRDRTAECNRETDETILQHLDAVKGLLEILEPGWIERTGG